MNINAKGRRGEIEFSDYLTKRGHPAQPGPERRCAGGADIDCPSLPDFQFEVKRVENIQEGMLGGWIDKAQLEAGDKMPVVAHRRNHQAWLVTMCASDFMQLLAGKFPAQLVVVHDGSLRVPPEK
jgi:hypothetical protein